MKKILILFSFLVSAVLVSAQEFTTLPVDINSEAMLNKSFIKKSGEVFWGPTNIDLRGNSSMIIQMQDCPYYADFNDIGSTVNSKQFIISESADGSSYSNLLTFKSGWGNIDKKGVRLKSTTRYIKIQYNGGTGLFAGIGDFASIFVAANIEFTGVETMTTDRFNAVSSTTHIKANNIGGDINITCANPRVQISPATVTKADAEAGVDVTVTYTPTADQTETIVLRATDSSNADNYDEISTSVVVSSAPTSYAVTASDLEFVRTEGEVSAQEVTLTGVSIDNPETVTVTGDFVIRKKGDSSFAKSIVLTPVKGSISDIIEVTYEATSDNIRSGIITFGTQSVSIHLLEPLVISFNPITEKTYGDEPFEYVVNTNNTIGVIDYAFSDPNVLSIENGKLKVLNAGETTLTASQAKGNGFTAGSAQLVVTVNKAPLTVTAQNATRTYGEANPEFTYTVSGLKYSDDNSVITVAPTLATTADATTEGQAPITISGGEVTSNYELNYVDGILTIDPMAVTLTIAAIDPQIYGNEIALPQVITINNETAVTFEVEDESIAKIVDGKLQMIGVGATKLVATQAGNGKYAQATNSTSITVNKAMLTVTAKSAQKYADEQDPEFFVEYAGFAMNENSDILDTKPSITRVDGYVPGEYDIIASGAVSSKYDFTYVNGKLTIKIAPSTMTMSPVATQIYGNEVVLPQVTSRNTETQIQLRVEDESIAKIVDGKLQMIGVGSTNLLATQAGNEKFEAGSASTSITVNKAPLTITAKSYTKYANEVDPEFVVDYTGFVMGDNVDVLATKPSVTRADGYVPGEYDIVASGAVSSKYDFTYVNGKLTIQIVPVTITFPDLSAKVYGDEILLSQATTINPETEIAFSVQDERVAKIENGVLKMTGVGATNLIATQAGNEKYMEANASFPIQVAKAGLTLTAKNMTRNIGEPNPKFQYTVSGLKFDDDNSVILEEPVMTCAATAETLDNVPIVISGGKVNDNYTLSYVNGLLTIKLIDPVISLPNIAIRTYGDVVSLEGTTSENKATELTFSIEDEDIIKMEGNTLTMIGAGNAKLRIKQPKSGKYAEVDKTYPIYVKRALLVVSAKDAERIVGESNPAFEYEVSGFKLNDDREVLVEEPTLSCLADATSLVGKYSIAIMGGKVNKNYELAYRNAYLTVKDNTSAENMVRSGAIYYNGGILYVNNTVKEVIVSGTSGAQLRRIMNPVNTVDLASLGDGQYIITIITASAKPYSFMIEK